MATRTSPFIKRLRINGGTIYTFSSSVEDIGLNINERNNFVKISHFALLELPNIAESSTGYKNNTFNIRNINGAWEYEQNSTSVKDGRVLIAESFQNYALNLESNLLAQTTYNPQLSTTVSERVFWKWLKETGAIRWADPSTSNETLYWQEEGNSNNYSSVVKYVGQITAGNVRIDTFGTYNETYILVPTSHGQTNAYFKQIEDDNYKHRIEIKNGGENILGRDTYTSPHPDGLSYKAYYDFVDSSTRVGTTPYYTYYDNSTGTYIPGWWYNAEGFNPTSTHNAYMTDSSNYITNKIYNVDLKYQNGGSVIQFRRSKVDCVSLELNLNNLKNIYGDSTLTYDKLAKDYQVDDSFMFNAVLIYYSVYNSVKDTLLATNLLGIMFLDAPSGNSSQIGTGLQGITLPSLEKIASGINGFGTSYSLRLNIKTDNMLDDTQATIIDESTSDQLWGEEWQETFENLAIAVNTLTQQNSTFNFISGQYVLLQANQTQLLNRLISLEYTVNDIGRDIQGTTNTVPLFSDGDDPLVESSIYMKYGKVGIFNNDPKWAVHIDGSVKTYDIIIQNNIRDTSDNILLGYGSPLQIGASTNYRSVYVYTGKSTPALKIDTSNNINITSDVSIKGLLYVDGSTRFKSLVTFESSIYSSYFDFSKHYLKIPQEIGNGLSWDGTYLNVLPTHDVSAPGIPGDIMFSYLGGALGSDTSSRIFWDYTNGRLGVGTKTPSYTTHIVGKLNVDGSIYRNGIEINTNPAGSNSYIQYNNAGSFGATSSLRWDASVLNINGNITFTSNASRTLSIASTTSQRLFTITSNNQSGSAGNGGIVIIKGGNAGSSSGTGGDVSISGGGGLTSGTGGKLNLYGGYSVTSYGGHTYLYGGHGNIGGNLYIGGGDGSINAGNLYIEPGSGYYPGGIFINGGNGTTVDGSISIGLNNTSGIYIGPNLLIPSSSTGTYLGGTQILYIDSSDNNKIKRTSIPRPTVSWYGSVGSNNCIITGNGDGSIVAETTLLYSSRLLTGSTGGSLTVATGNDGSLNILGGNSSNIAGNVYIKAGDGSTGGNIKIISGTGSVTGSGNIYIYPSSSATLGNVYLANNGSTDYSRTIFSSGTVSAPGISFRAQLGTGFYYTSGQLNVAMSGSNKFRFTSAGVFYAYDDIVSYYTSLSDIRLKDNVKCLGPSLDKIVKLQGIEYDKKSDGEHHIGFIAQEVEKIIPEVVHEVEAMEYNGLYKSIRYDEIIPYLVESIKEQQKMINELKEEIKTLKK